MSTSTARLGWGVDGFPKGAERARLEAKARDFMDSLTARGMLESIRPGDRVTISVPNGIGRNGQEWKASTGRAVMPGPAGWVLNMGGPHGTPGIASAENIVSVRARV